MVKLYDSGVYLLNGKTLVREKDAELSLNKEEAKMHDCLWHFASAQYQRRPGKSENQI